MFLRMFSIYDSKVAAFLQPFFMPNVATAMRALYGVSSDSGHDFVRFSGDYTVFELGVWDAEKGEISFHDSKLNLGTMTEILANYAPIENPKF